MTYKPTLFLILGISVYLSAMNYGETEKTIFKNEVDNSTVILYKSTDKNDIDSGHEISVSVNGESVEIKDVQKSFFSASLTIETNKGLFYFPQGKIIKRATFNGKILTLINKVSYVVKK